MGIDVLRMNLLNPENNDEEFVKAAVKFFKVEEDKNAFDKVPEFLYSEDRKKLYNYLLEDHRKTINSHKLRELMSIGDPNGEMRASFEAAERINLATRNVKGYLALKSNDEKIIEQAIQNGSIDNTYLVMMENHKKMAEIMTKQSGKSTESPQHNF